MRGWPVAGRAAIYTVKPLMTPHLYPLPLGGERKLPGGVLWGQWTDVPIVGSINPANRFNRFENSLRRLASSAMQRFNPGGLMGIRTAYKVADIRFLPHSPLFVMALMAAGFIFWRAGAEIAPPTLLSPGSNTPPGPVLSDSRQTITWHSPENGQVAAARRAAGLHGASLGCARGARHIQS